MKVAAVLSAALGASAASASLLDVFTNAVVPADAVMRFASRQVNDGTGPSVGNITVFQNVLYNISNKTADTNEAIKAFTVKTVLDLQDSSSAVVAAINQGIADCQAQGNINATDAVSLTPIISQLSMLVNETISNVIRRKEDFGGVWTVVSASLAQQNNGTGQLNAVISTKLPSTFITIAATLTAPILASLNMGIVAFEEPNINYNDPVFSLTNAAPRVGAGAFAVAGLAAAAIAAALL